MSGVDDRIVSMKFDNASFEQKLSDTLGSLDKLRQSLDLSNSTKGFEHITAAANAVNLGTIASGVDGIASKFSAMSIVAITALTNIANKAVTSGLAFAKSFAVAPITDGFGEMETKMGSIQTILANTSSKGTTLDQVTASLDELNHYADKTIYNFGEMTKNIGLFTNAGIGIEDATAMIKGFSNSAAASGTNAQAAAGAAYQLSQALSAGTIRLMDWRSLTNAGMGNKNMQNGIIEIASAMGELDKAGISSQEIQGNFNASLEKNWLSADVMTKYLKIMAGEMSETEMAQMGLTAAQIDNFKKQQKIAEDAATKVRTFSQLVGTAKEAIGSGWSETFELILGNFDQATELFTNINNAVGGFIGRVSDARNELLRGWAAFGGRDTAIEGLKNAFGALGDILSAVAKAFRSVFPATTSYELIQMTNSFANFTENLRELVNKWLPAITVAFTAVFTVVKIVWEVIKGVVGVFFDLVGAIGSLVGGDGAGFFRNLGSSVSKLQDLVARGVITNFFEKIGEYIKNAAGYVQDFKDKVVGLFDGFSGSEAVEKTSENVTESLGLLAGAAEFVREAFGHMTERFSGIAGALGGVFETIAGFLGGLGQKLADLIKPSDFDHAVDAVNVGLLGGILIVLKKFLNGGLKIDFSGGLFDSIKKSFDTLTGTLKSMQAQLKAKALMKIATAIAVLTGSLVVLSMIDSDKLTKALIAMSVGFGQLVGTMALIDKIGMSPMKMNGLATSMILMSTAMGILSMAVTNFSQLDAGALVKGLGGVAASMVMMVAAMKLMESNTPGMIKASIAMGAVGVALLVIAKVVTVFSDMNLKEMGQGLLGVAASMLIIAVGMKAINTKATLGSGLAMLALAFSLKNMADAVQAFANIPWPEIAQGTASITVLLLALSVALRNMPDNLVASAAGLVLVSGALVVMAKAVETMGSIKMGDMAKGLGAITLLLIELSLALNVMNGTAAGAASLLVASGALLVLSGVLKVLGGMSLGEIMKSLIALGGALTIVGIAALALAATGATAALLALGVAVGLLGGGIALLGGGVFLMAKGFQILAKSGVDGVKAFVGGIKVLIDSIPELIGSFVKSLATMAKNLIMVVPLFIQAFRVIMSKILDVVIELSPKVAQALQAILLSGLELIKEVIPSLIETGFAILGALLEGILSNTAGITLTVIEIFSRFATAVMDNMATIVAAAAGIILSFITEIAGHASEFIKAGLDLLVNLLLGISNNIGKVVTAVLQIITTILDEFVNAYSQFVEAGLGILTELIRGVIDNVEDFVTMVVTLVTKFVDTLSDNAQKFIDAGFKVLTDLLSGIANNIIKVVDTVGDIAIKFVTAMGEKAQEFVDSGLAVLTSFLWGIEDNLDDILDTAVKVTLKFLENLSDSSIDFISGASEVLLKFLRSLEEVIRRDAPEIRRAALGVADAIIDGITGGLSASKAINAVVDKAKSLARSALDAAKNFLGINSPSRKFIEIGSGMVEGMVLGLKDTKPAENSAEELGKNVISIFRNSAMKIAETVEGIENFQPVIAPVLDLTKVQAQARGLQGLVDASPRIVPVVSMERARTISTTTEMAREAAATQEPTYTGPSEINFTQINNSPTALSTNDIYRNTKSQIAMAKEELEIA